jgi:hypothetical protein
MQKLIVIFIFIAGLGLQIRAGLLPEKSESDLLFIKSKGEVSLYENPDAGANTRQYIATLTMELNIEKIIALIQDETFALSWIKGTCEYTDLTSGDRNWYSYLQFAPPWPLNHQDCILHFTLNEFNEERATIQFVNLPDYIPVKERTTRIKNFEGKWKLELIDDSTTKVSFIMYSDVFTSSELKKSIILNTILNSLATLKEKAIEKEQEMML